MHSPTNTRLAWCTAAHNDSAKSTRADLLALGEHLNACPQLHRHLMTLHGATEVMNGFVATRFVSTLLVLALVIGLGAWML
ncbi:hypothetical protein [Rhodoferax sp.]|uniref:hypothetical protein n=1 Tax=Rhodoferax sp. TaxID=50421 RepID=UPI0025DBD1EB|nr:hypothetical protein [Rhodoferax sp.]